MSSSKKTPYYNLSQFQDADKPSWRGDYNGDMDKIDTGLQSVKTSAIDAKTAAQNAESSVNEVKRDYLKKTDVQNTYATKTELNDTKTAIENNADNKFVAKTVYDTAIANKADKISVYTKTESDGKYLTKTAADETYAKKKKHIVLIGDSYLTGYQPSASALAENSRIGNIAARALGLTPHVFANNASGFKKAGDGGKVFMDLVNSAATDTASIAADVSDVVICSGRNDTEDVGTETRFLIEKCTQSWPNAHIHVMFLWDNHLITSTGSTVLNSIRSAVNKHNRSNVVSFSGTSMFWGMTHPEFFVNGSDIHPNSDGAQYYGNMIASEVSGSPAIAANSGQIALSSPFSGNIKWNINNGILSIIGKFSCTGSVTSGTTICAMPLPFDLGDGFITAIMGLGGGDKIAFLRLTQGNLEYTGAAGGGDMSGTVWITPQSWTAIRGL